MNFKHGPMPIKLSAADPPQAAIRPSRCAVCIAACVAGCFLMLLADCGRGGGS